MAEKVKLSDLTPAQREERFGWISRERNGDELYEMAQHIIRTGEGWVRASRTVRGDGGDNAPKS